MIIFAKKRCRHELPQPKRLNAEISVIGEELNKLTGQAKGVIDYLLKVKEALGDE